ncbi:DUF4126 domain-containing protein [uncultured Thiodictyon sp.]|uniref:DUF4126 domain-containing protein n=1 Tax=uncultured Thiodictyon sp. TaxID=1846217 RepID=UPI0025D28B9C|nr:DUF4126 domain-containing protein [uncultured Thiodictyon sp.]
MDTLTQTLALTLGASWASGINLYATMLVLGLAGATGTVDLPPGLDILSDPRVLAAAGLMFIVEFFADKVPGVDSAWDGLHTFIRIPAGALMAMGAAGDVGPVGDTLIALLGGGVAAASHATKAGTRIMLNTSPEPFTNWIASVTEDVGVVGGLLLALTNPGIFLICLALFFLLLIWLLPMLWHGIKRVGQGLRRRFGGGGTAATEPPALDAPPAADPGDGAPPRLDAQPPRV